MSGKSNHHGGHKFQRYTVTGERSSGTPSLSKMDPPYETDKKTGGASQEEVEQQQPLQLLPRELPLPGCDAGCERRHNGDGGAEQVEARRCQQGIFLLRALREAPRQVESHSRQKKRDRKMD